MTNSTLSTIKLYAEALEDGGTYRGDCPECGRKSTFTITRQGQGFVYNCYSTNCTFRGAHGAHPQVPMDNLVRTKPIKKLNPFKGPTEALTSLQRKFLANLIGFQDRHIYKSGIRFAPVEDRYAYPIFSPAGRRRGYVLRSYEEIDPAYKALTYMETDEPHLSWYGPFNPDYTVVVVEDIPSAVRASVHRGPVVAMCGGGIGHDALKEITTYVKNVVWAFDPDAIITAINHHTRYSMCFNSSRVLRLERDFKNMEESVLAACLSEV